MENHPIPQDVTGFQFKLIGDMTVKQFAYIAVGVVLAFAFFYMPIFFLIKIPLALFFALFGVGLAFLPVEGRPFDAMIGYFLKALLTPNQYAYHKVGGKIALFDFASPSTQHSAAQNLQKHTVQSIDQAKPLQLQQYLNSVQKQTITPQDQKEEVFLQHILTNPSPQQAPPIKPQIPQPSLQKPLPQQPTKADAPLTPKEIEEQEANLSLEAASVKYELDEAKNQEAKEKDHAKQPTVHEHVLELEKKLEVLLHQKEQLEKELQVLKAQTAPATQQEIPQKTQVAHTPQEVAQSVTQKMAPPPQPATPSVVPIAKPPPPTPAPTPTVRKIPADMAKSVGLPHMPDVANLIVGIVKDPRGNVLPNVLVEVKDKDGVPARAFRTNSLGQFASATPLSPGEYTVEFEDPKGQHAFDVVEINPHGEVMLPLEIISHDEREELRKELFS